jgi:hypothetical protein
VSGRSLVGVSIAAATALVALYLVLGGGSYEPTPVADPCAHREWRDPRGVEESAQQFALSALDGAACKLGVSRETLAVALATPESRKEFAATYGIGDAEFEAAVRAGVARGIDDAEAAGALSPLVATGLRAIAARLPVDEAAALIRDGRKLFDGTGGLLDQLGNLPG